MLRGSEVGRGSEGQVGRVVAWWQPAQFGDGTLVWCGGVWLKRVVGHHP